MKQFYLLLLLLATCTLAEARQIDEAKAREIAQSFFNNKGNFAGSPRLVRQSSETNTLQKSRTPNVVSQQPGYYVFTAGDRADDKGFVIVSGDDELKPVIGWSDNTVYDPDRMPRQLRAILEEYDNYLADFRAGKALAAQSRGGAAVSPLMTTRWNQDIPYNLYTPIKNSVQTPTGCVATAMAQVMKYHNYPPKGHGYIEAWTYAPADLNLDESVYDWGNMLDRYVVGQYSDTEAAAVARLMYDAGRSVEMMYEMTESGAYDTSIAGALYKYFNYDEAIRFRSREFFGSQAWIDMVRESLLRGEPVIYSGSSAHSGHQFVCDGIDSDDYFHINWGWGGYCDGYFDLNAFVPSGVGIGGGDGDYYRDHTMIINIRPGDPDADHSGYIQPPIIREFRMSGYDNRSYLIVQVDNASRHYREARSVGILVDLYDSNKKLLKDSWIISKYPYLLRPFTKGTHSIDTNFKGIADGDYYISLRYTTDSERSYGYSQKYDYVGPFDIACDDFVPVKVKDGMAVIEEKSEAIDNIVIEGIESTTEIYDLSTNIELGIAVRNNGSEMVSSYKLSAYCVADADWTEDLDLEKLEECGSLYIDQLYSEASRIFTCYLYLNKGLTPGVYRLILAANGNKVKMESDCKFEVIPMPSDAPMVMMSQLSNSNPTQDNLGGAYMRLSWTYYAPREWADWYYGKVPLQLWGSNADDPEDEFLMCEIEDSGLQYDNYSSAGRGSAKVTCYPELSWRAPGKYRMWLKYNIDGEWVVIPGENNLCEFSISSTQPTVSYIELAAPADINGGKPVEIGKEFEVKLTFTSPTGIQLSEENSYFTIRDMPSFQSNTYNIDWQPLADKWELEPGECCEITAKFVLDDYWAATYNYDINSLAGKTLLVFPAVCEEYEYGSVLALINYNEYIPSLYFTVSEPAGISEITVDTWTEIDYTLPYEVYNINGSLIELTVDNLSSGVYIIRQGSCAEKYIIK